MTQSFRPQIPADSKTSPQEPAKMPATSPLRAFRAIRATLNLHTPNLRNLRHLRFAFALLALVSLFAPAVLPAQAPQMIPLQGQLTEQDGDPLADGVYSYMVNIYADANSGDEIWSDSYENQPVIKGVFNILLGSQEPLTSVTTTPPSPAGTTLFDILSEEGVLYVGVTITKVNGSPVTGGGVEMRPRLSLVPVAYAIESRKTQTFGPDAANANAYYPYGSLFTGLKAKNAVTADTLQGADWGDLLTDGQITNGGFAPAARIKDSLLVKPIDGITGIDLMVGLDDEDAEGRVLELSIPNKKAKLAADVPGYEGNRVRGVYVDGVLQVGGEVTMPAGIVVGGGNVIDGEFYYLADTLPDAGKLRTYSSSPSRLTAFLVGVGTAANKLSLIMKPVFLFDAFPSQLANPLLNPGFESTASWLNNGGTMIQRTDYKCSGASSSQSSSELRQDVQLDSQLHGLIDTNGVECVYGASIFHPAAGANAAIAIRFHSGVPPAGMIGSEQSINAAFSTTCQQFLSTPVCIPSGTRYIRFIVREVASAGHFVDDAVLELRPTMAGQCP